MARKYPPLLFIALALFLALVVLPSSLKLPQSNPSTTLEYAPVPPGDSDVAPPGGNLASLGLASSGTLGATGDGATVAAPAGPLLGRGKSPSTKRCIGNPPRQTADPLAPPCVAFFEGNNFGATHNGVTQDEIRILLRWGGGYTGTSQGYETAPPDGTYVDLWDPPPADKRELTIIRALRVWQVYFNDRYQTYGRRAHFIVSFGYDGSNERARARAAEHITKVRPFAVFPVYAGYADAYADAMAARGVMVFGSVGGRTRDFFRRYPGLVWSYAPPLEQMAADLYSTYVCQKAKPYPVSFSGNALDNSKPRKYGLVYSNDPAFSYLQKQKDLVLKGLTACGVQITATATFTGGAYAFDGRSNLQDAITTMSQFRDRGVTTILWPGGTETNMSKAAASISYQPEWITLGDGIQEGFWTTQQQNQLTWSHVWVVTPQLLQGRNSAQQVCVNEYAELDPESDPETLDYRYACLFYNDMRQVFTGIQVAGPRLTPQTMDKGFHAIPAVASSSPLVPACYYDAGDYTCVKDGVQMWWDPSAPNSNFLSSGSGCYRMPEGGKRYLPGQWPPGDVPAQQTRADPCNGYGGELLSR